jgi:hypothetical protein
MNNAASFALSAATNATQQPRKPAPLNLAPITPGAFCTIANSCTISSHPGSVEENSAQYHSTVVDHAVRPIEHCKNDNACLVNILPAYQDEVDIMVKDHVTDEYNLTF